MNGRFIYVFSIEDRDRLITYGYRLMTEDIVGNVFVFENSDHREHAMTFSSELQKYVMSDVLVF